MSYFNLATVCDVDLMTLAIQIAAGTAAPLDSDEIEALVNLSWKKDDDFKNALTMVREESNLVIMKELEAHAFQQECEALAEYVDAWFPQA